MNFSPQYSHYRWPIIFAVGLHALIFICLIVNIFFYHPSDNALQPRSIQAMLISTSQLSAMMSPLPHSNPQITPVKATEQKESQKQTSVIPKNQPQNTKQKSLEEMMLQEELNSPQDSYKNLRAKQATLMDQQLVAEEGETQKAERSQKTLAEINKYKALILRQIQQNWIVPQNVQNLFCLLQVNVAPGGMVIDVKVLKSSGNDVLDRSAITAVNKSSPLPVPKDGAAFSAFRTFTLTVKPEGNELSESLS